MKQESRFVAELYRYLSPFIDTDKELYLSLDGMTARKGVSNSKFVDPDVPDLWFTLIGSTRLILLEAKILHANESIPVNPNQLAAWCSLGPGKHKPTAWVAANEKLTTFFYWTHADFLPRLDAGNVSKSPTFKLPDERIEFPDVRQLALHVLRYA
ncbi:MAG TPA: hypothetical protein VFA21_16840 [Pyrinomonadaceae bacterium]|nr:hypothetical protein [Pyrinomonadaceae bacterium]